MTAEALVMPVSPTVDEAYAFCRSIAHRYGSNFSVGFRFLPTVKRKAVYAAYAWCRWADDIADEPSDSAESVLDRLAGLYRVINGVEGVLDSVLVAPVASDHDRVGRRTPQFRHPEKRLRCADRWLPAGHAQNEIPDVR